MTRSNRLWTIGTVTIMAVLLIAGWFLGAQPLLASAAAADAERSAVETQNVAHQAQIAQLVTEKKQLPTLLKDFATLDASIPSTSDTSSFITGLNSLAIGAGVQITGITVGDPQAYTIPASAQVAAPSTDSVAPTPAATAAPEPVATGPQAPTATTNPLITPANFVGIQVAVSVAGQYDAVLAFTKGLQSGDRLFLVTGFASDRSLDNPDANFVTATVSGYIYVLRQVG
jgi:Tfp pilus assembly protein PilO